MAKRIALLGGTFNPVHHAHLIVARAVAERLGFEKVTLVPARIPPHKLTHCHGHAGKGGVVEASAEDRLAMARLAVAGEDLLDVSDVEIRRTGPSYTYDTLMEFRRQHGQDAELFWIVGTDMLADLPNWYRAAEVVEAATIITAARLPYTQYIEGCRKGLEQAFSPAQVDKLLSHLVPTPVLEISATDIRHRVEGGQSVRFLTPDSVIDYINTRKLYCSSSM